MLEGKVVHIPDVTADPEYVMSEMVTLGNWRTYLGVPLLREGAAVGVITLNWLVRTYRLPVCGARH